MPFPALTVCIDQLFFFFFYSGKTTVARLCVIASVHHTLSLTLYLLLCVLPKVWSLAEGVRLLVGWGHDRSEAQRSQGRGSRRGDLNVVLLCCNALTVDDQIPLLDVQSAANTAAVIEKAKGKVLFIDEAYGLDPARNNNTHGGDVLDTLVEKMEGSAGQDLAVILPGYEQMREMFKNCGNPGLHRRFNLDDALALLR